ncbi:MAG: hypothetical protein ACYTFK_09895 [Planctomycetota bacterium]|jgi:hypothetical protein
MKKLIMFFMVMMLCLGIAGKAQGELACLELSPAGAGLGDEVTMTGYDEEGAVLDLAELEVFESNFHHGELGYYPGLVCESGECNEYVTGIVDGSIVFTLTDEMLQSDVTMWDCFFIPGGDDFAFRLCNVDPEDETSHFETVAEVLENGGTCSITPNPIVIDPNVMTVEETGETVGDFLVSMQNALPAGKTTTVTVDPNNGAPSEDIMLIGGDPVTGSITLTFTDSDWDVPQRVVYKAIDDSIAEPPELLEAQEIVVTSVYSDTLQDPNWAGEKAVKVEVLDNDQANILFSLYGTPLAAGTAVRVKEQIECGAWMFGNCTEWVVIERTLGVKLQVAPSGGDVKVAVFVETGDHGNVPNMDPSLTTASDPNVLTFTSTTDQAWVKGTMTSGWNVEQEIVISGNDDDVLQIDEAGAEGDQNYGATVIFVVIDGGGDERYQWQEEEEEETVTIGLERAVDVLVEDNECGAFGISHLDIGNPNAATDPNYLGEDGNPLPDCYVNIHDLIEFAKKWLNCSDPKEPACASYLE